jgi:ketosteroid isomerase-like protein
MDDSMTRAASDEAAVVLAWHAALNDGDVERLLGLTTADVEVGGPRGVGHGAELLRDWVGRAGIRLVPGRLIQDGPTLVVEQDAEWRSADTGEVTGSQRLASIFTVTDGRVARTIRYPDVDSALEAAGIRAVADG